MKKKYARGGVLAAGDGGGSIFWNNGMQQPKKGFIGRLTES